MRTLMMASEPFHEVSDEVAEKIMALVKADKPKPKFYHYGQHFKRDGNEYTLVEIGLREVQMINVLGTSVWSSRIGVASTYNITEEEFKQICGPKEFVLIK